MTVDVDRILRAHADEAGRIEPDPDGWDRLVARLGEAAPQEPPFPERRAAWNDQRRWPLLAAAAVLVVVGVSAAVALVRSADGGVATTPATDATETTGDPEPTDTQPTPETSVADPDGGRPEIDEATMPDGVVALVDHDGDGLTDLVRMTGIHPEARPEGGYRVATPEVTVLVPGSAVSPAAMTDVDITADGTVLYLVGEEVWRIDPTSGITSGPVAQGTVMAVSGDGRVLATVIGDVIRLYGLDVRGGQPFADMDIAGDGEVTGLALSTDGTRIARQRVARAADGTIAASAVDVAVVATLDDWVEVERSSGVGLPAFMPDGHLAVGLGTTGTSAGHEEVRASEVGMVDLATGEVRWSVGGGGFSFTSFDASPDGLWVLVHQDGTVRAFAAVDGWLWDSGTVVQSAGMIDVAW